MRAGVDAGLQVPAVRALDLVEQFSMIFGAAGAGFILRNPVQQVGRTGGDVLLHGLVAGELKFLRQITNPQPAPPENLPAVRGLFTGQNLQQAGLPAPVAADQADFLARRHGQRDVRQ